jgi:hypothetical protein
MKFGRNSTTEKSGKLAPAYGCHQSTHMQPKGSLQVIENRLITAQLLLKFGLRQFETAANLVYALGLPKFVNCLPQNPLQLPGIPEVVQADESADDPPVWPRPER